MTHLGFSPEWFFGYDVAIEMALAAVALLVAILSFRVYKKTSGFQIRLFGISFTLISVSYMIQSILNFLIITKANENICGAIRLQSIITFNYAGLMIHILLMTIGYTLLVYTTFRAYKKRLLWLLLIMTVLGIFLSSNIIFMFYLYSTIYLVFLSYHFISNYLKNRQSKTLLVAIAFLFMLFGSFHYIISVNHELFYAIGHILELIAYILILANLYLIFKK